MKIKIDSYSFEQLRRGTSATSAACLNDDVSTTRHDAVGKLHQYDDRYTLLKAFMFASKSHILNVCADECKDTIRARVVRIGGVAYGGLIVHICLDPVETAKPQGLQRQVENTQQVVSK